MPFLYKLRLCRVPGHVTQAQAGFSPGDKSSGNKNENEIKSEQPRIFQGFSTRNIRNTVSL